MNDVIIREAMLSDAEGIAVVHVESWKSTYGGIMPADILAARTLELRTQQWTARLSQHDPSRRLIIAESEQQITAFALFGVSRWADMPFTHELYAIYSLQHVQRRGIGKKLVRSGVQWLIGQGAQSMILWVLKENLSARVFYESLGGQMVAERIDPDFHAPVLEIAYGWTDLHALVKRLSG